VLARKQASEEAGSLSVKYKQLNLKCIKSNGLIDTTLLEDYETNERLGRKYLTQPDDIVIRLSYPYTAALIDEENTGLVIPSHFAVIRADKTKLLPRYLLWLLSREKTKKELNKYNTGFVIGTVKSSFFVMSVPLKLAADTANNPYLTR